MECHDAGGFEKGIRSSKLSASAACSGSRPFETRGDKSLSPTRSGRPQEAIMNAQQNEAEIVRHGRNASNLSTGGMVSAFKQNEEFAKWWEQWVRRIQQTRAYARKFTINA